MTLSLSISKPMTVFQLMHCYSFLMSFGSAFDMLCSILEYRFSCSILANCHLQIAGSGAASRGKECGGKQDEREARTVGASKAHRRR